MVLNPAKPGVYSEFPVRPIARNAVSVALKVPEITSPLAPFNGFSASESLLLTIPLEIRLQIYHYVLLSNPIHHKHLAPVFPTANFTGRDPPECHTPITSKLYAAQGSLSICQPIPSATAPPLKIHGKIPTSLLSACKQIYYESRLLAWHTNDFTFNNWFWSGVYAARHFTRGLESWQSDAIRHVGIEVLARDLAPDGMNWMGGGISGATKRAIGVGKTEIIGEWGELCTLWKGVWVLRLRIRGSLVAGPSEVSSADTRSNVTEEAPYLHRLVPMDVLDVTKDWVTNGLLNITTLRQLELEIEDEDVSRDVKLLFCMHLGNIVNSETLRARRRDGYEGYVKVVFVERVKVEERASNTDFAWYGGQPGNDSVWGTEM